jgi:spermidine synthase
VGLGVGTLAAYAQPGDSVRFYEINPEARRMAQTYFTYLNDCPAPHPVVMGDARLSLEREPPQDFDLLVLDAFSGHAVPAHLLTREAMAIYRRHLKPDGVVVFNVTIQFLDLQAVVQKLAEQSGLQSMLVRHDGNRDRKTFSSRWMLLTRDAGLHATIPAAQVVPPSAGEGFYLWTDSYTNILPIMRIRR